MIRASQLLSVGSHPFVARVAELARHGVSVAFDVSDPEWVSTTAAVARGRTQTGGSS